MNNVAEVLRVHARVFTLVPCVLKRARVRKSRSPARGRWITVNCSAVTVQLRIVARDNAVYIVCLCVIAVITFVIRRDERCARAREEDPRISSPLSTSRYFCEYVDFDGLTGRGKEPWIGDEKIHFY